MQKATAKNDVGIVGTWAGNGPMLWVDHLASRHHLTLGGSLSTYLDSGVNPDRRAVAAPRRHLRRHDRPLLRRRRRGREPSRSRAASATRTPGASAPTAARRAASSTASSTRSASTTARSARPRSRPTATSRSGSPTPARRRRPGTSPSPGARRPRSRSAWTASTDDTGVAGYTSTPDGAAAGTTTATSFTVTGLTCSTGYQLEVEAFDAAGNTSPRASVDRLDHALRRDAWARRGVRVRGGIGRGRGRRVRERAQRRRSAARPGPPAATAAGSRSTASTTTSRSAASAPSTTPPSRSKPGCRRARAKKDVAIVGSWTGSGPMLWVDHLAGHHYLTLGSSLSSYLDSGQSPAPDSGSTSRPPSTARPPATTSTALEVAARAISGSVGSSNTWRIGAYGGSSGRLLRRRRRRRPRLQPRAQRRRDPVRPRPRRQSARHASRHDPAERSPGTLTATPGAGQAALTGARRPTTSASPATTSTARRAPGFTPSAGEPDRAADRDELHRHGSRGGRSTTTRSPPRTPPATRPGLERGRREPSPTRRRRALPGTLTATGGHRPGVAVLGRRDRQRRRRPLQRPPLDDLRLHAVGGEPDRAADRPELHRHRPRRRHVLLQGHRRGRRRATSALPRTRRARRSPPTRRGRPCRSPRRRRARPSPGVTTSARTRRDNVAVAGVQFRVDGVNVGAEDLTAPVPSSPGTRAAS